VFAFGRSRLDSVFLLRNAFLATEFLVLAASRFKRFFAATWSFVATRSDGMENLTSKAENQNKNTDKRSSALIQDAFGLLFIPLALHCQRLPRAPKAAKAAR
jgi:hypothetical protein